MTERYKISRGECLDNWQRQIFDSAFAQGVETELERHKALSPNRHEMGAQMNRLANKNIEYAAVLDDIRDLHFKNSTVSDWNKLGEDLCDSCLVPFPCPTAEVLSNYDDGGYRG